MYIVRATPIAVHSYNCSCLFLSGKTSKRHSLSPRSSATVYGVSGYFDEREVKILKEEVSVCLINDFYCFFNYDSAIVP